MSTHAIQIPVEYQEFVGASKLDWPGPAKLRWHAHHIRRHASSYPLHRLMVAFQFFRRGAHLELPLRGNPLVMFREGRLTIGPECILEAGCTLQSGSGRILLGRGVEMNRGAVIGAGELVVIGDYCMIAQGCYITDVDHKVTDPELPIARQGMVTKGPTVIEDNVWLGCNVVVTSGVRIGRHSVIGANSVVTRDIPPYSIAAGSPARPTKSLQPASLKPVVGE